MGDKTLNAIHLQWRDRNWAEQGHYIYRSKTPMNPYNLPSPIASVGKNATQFFDYDVVKGEEYYYRVASFRNNDVEVSEEIKLKAEPLPLGIGPDIEISSHDSLVFYGEFNGNEHGLNVDTLSSMIDLTAGNIPYPNENQWLKFKLDGEVILFPKQPLRSSISWQDIYQAGAVYGTDDYGTFPSGGNRTQDARVVLDGFTYRVTLLSMNVNDGTGSGLGTDQEWTHGSEWNRSLYNLVDEVYPSQEGPNLAYYTNDELYFRTGNGTRTWTSTTVSNGQKAHRGNQGVAYNSTRSATVNSSNWGWRPALRLEI